MIMSCKIQWESFDPGFNGRIFKMTSLIITPQLARILLVNNEIEVSSLSLNVVLN